METLSSLTQEFLSLSSIAVVGISSKKQSVANMVCRKLRTPGRTVYAVGRNTAAFDGTSCYPELASLPAPVQGVFIAVKSEHTGAIIDQCIALKITHVWMHNSGGTALSSGSSATAAAIQRCRDNNITVIPGACPMMYVPNADLGHRCMKWFLSVTGNLK
ncbi:MAG: CoA-binding protein [Bacteroidota bacterium]